MYFDLLKISQGQQQVISGPAVDDLIATVNTMFGRGAPTRWDYTGFNKLDYNNPKLYDITNYSPGASVPVALAVDAMRILQKYKKTQLPNYDQLASDLQALISQATGIATPSGQPTNKITYVGQEWGSAIFHIPGLGRKTKTIFDAIKQQMTSQGLNPADYWKMFYRSKKGIDLFRVQPDYLDIVKPILSQKGYDVSEMVIPVQVQQQMSQKIVEAVGIEEEGNFLVKLKFLPFDKDLVTAAKEWRSRSYDKQTKTWTLSNPTVDFIKAYISVAQKLGYDTSQLNTVLEQIDSRAESGQLVPGQAPIQQQVTAQGVKLKVVDVTDRTQNQWHLGFGFYRRDTDEAEYLKEIIKFAFPAYGADGQRFVDNDKWQYLVRGDYSDYRRLHDIFQRYGFDTGEFDRLVNDLIDREVVGVGRVVGDLDGFQTEYKDAKGRTRLKNDPDRFYKYLEDNYERPVEKGGKIIDFKLYPEQKEDIAFLYGRHSGLLGSATGTGKTLVMLLAADMRMRNSGGNSLVITQNDIVQKQWMDEIKRFAGATDKEISADPTHGAKWTIMTYHNFSTKGTRDYNVNVIQNQVREGKIACCILDEIDNVKNSGSKRTENIQNITSFEDPDGTSYKIPFVWGGSATIVANRPVDVYNQLRAINHPLGEVNFRTFATDFGAMVRGRYGLEDGPIDEQIKAANKLKEWLINYGVYIQRTKKDIREDMPEHVITEDDIPVSVEQVYAKARKRMEAYKDPSLPVSAMIAMRAELAEAKAPSSVAKMKPFLERGKKVAIFTMFRPSSFTLIQGLQQTLNEIGEGGKVGAITGGMQKKTKDQVIRGIKDPKSDMRAIVITISAGGTGLDFPNVTDQVRVNDFDWTPRSAEQSEGRFYRIITDADVHTTYSVAKGTEDEEFYNRVKRKRKIAQIVQNLTQKQMGMIMKGVRRDNKSRKKIEAELSDAIREQIATEEQDKTFMAQKARQIREKMEQAGGAEEETIAINWYGKTKTN